METFEELFGKIGKKLDLQINTNLETTPPVNIPTPPPVTPTRVERNFTCKNGVVEQLIIGNIVKLTYEKEETPKGSGIYTQFSRRYEMLSDGGLKGVGSDGTPNCLDSIGFRHPAHNEKYRD